MKEQLSEKVSNLENKTGERIYSRRRVLDIFTESVAGKSYIPQEEIEKTYSEIDRAFTQFETRETDRPHANCAFLIHSRRTGFTDEALDDVGRCLPALSQKYNLEDNRVDEIWNSLPPYEIGRIEGEMKNGARIDCSLISVPITPNSLKKAPGASARARYSNPRIKDAVSFAKDLGAQTVGLGETLASLTDHGRKLQNFFPDLKIVTGHTGTAYLIKEWVKFGTDIKHQEPEETGITIIGAHGAIGSTMLSIFIEEGYVNFNLHDKADKIGGLKNTILELEKKYPQLLGRFKVTGGNDNLSKACKNSDIIVSAASAAEPFIKRHNLKRGTIVVDDSQPPSITRGEAEEADSSIFWVVGKLPDGLDRDFDYGIKGEWGCALEVIATQVCRDKIFSGVGPVSYQNAKIFGEVARILGITIAEPQSFGKSTTIDFNR